MGVQDLIEKFDSSLSKAGGFQGGMAPKLCKKPESGVFGFAFDIDGVLVRGKTPIPVAAEALRLLQQRSIPFILLTNGGGSTEASHAQLVSDRLGVPIEEEQFVQSHTPFRSVVRDNAYHDKWVLVLGGAKDSIKKVAAFYGLNPDKILNSSDVFKHGVTNGEFTPGTPISAIFVFSSPRDWCLDLQLCLDLVLSEKGVLGTRSPKNGNEALKGCGYQQDGQPALYFCNPDVEWATSYPTPRLAQGGFRQALEGVFAGVTKGRASLRYWTCGKPTPTTYDFAESALEKRAAGICRAYMVGDNPASDILGAATAEKNPQSKLSWRSILVETGVHKPGAALAGNYKPSTVKLNVLEAVKWAIGEETKEEVI